MAAEKIKPKTITKRKPASKAQIADLILNKELTQRQAADLTGVCQQRISQIISDVKSDPETLLFINNKDKVFEGIQARFAKLASDDLLKTMMQKRGFTDMAIIQDKIQLLRGQATEIHDVSIRALIAGIEIKRQGNDESVPQPSPECANAEYEDDTQGRVNDLLKKDSNNR